MKNKILLAIATLTLFSCDDYLDVNENPNSLAQEKVTPALLLPGAMNNAFRVQARAMNNLGNIWMQNWGGDVNNFTGANINEYTLQINSNTDGGIWDGLYPAISNFQAVIDFPSESDDNHKAVAYILKSYYMQYIVDLYGDCPYSEAFKGQKNLTPKYDNDEDIYKDLVINIEKGIDLFYAADSGDNLLDKSDIMMSGNVTNWLRFANTLKMKILLRQSTLAQSNPTLQTYIQGEFAEIVANGAGFLTANATINPVYSNAEPLAQNPLYSLFFNNVGAAGTATQFNNFTRATDYISTWMNGTNIKTSAVPALVDPRRNRLYSGSGDISGAIQGETTGPAVMSQVGPGLLIGHNQNGIVISLAETRFMMSEAKIRTYLAGGVAGALTDFNAAVTASFTQLGAGSATAYLSNANLKPGVGWTATTDKIEAIMTQKWLATNGSNAMESYIENVRTGYPVIPLATIAQKPNRPYRLLYPGSELSANSANVPNVSLAQVFTQGAFWKN